MVGERILGSIRIGDISGMVVVCGPSADLLNKH